MRFLRKYVAASQDAFDDSYTPPGLTDAKHVQDALYIAPRTGALDNDAIKDAIVNHGAVYTSLYAADDMSFGGPDYNPASAAYVASKDKMCARLGMHSEKLTLPAATTEFRPTRQPGNTTELEPIQTFGSR